MVRRRAFAEALFVLCSVTGSLTSQGVRATVHRGLYLRQQVVCVPVIDGELGDVAFDPTDDQRLHVLVDDEILLGGGVYRHDEVDGMLVRGDLLASVDHPSGLTFTPDGDLWLVRDLGVANGYLFRLPSPRSGPSDALEVIITGFQGPDDDDDPKVLGVAPPGFGSDLVQPGDIIIGEAGADADPFNALYVLSPASPPAAPGAHDRFLVRPEALATYNDINLIDFDFSKSGTSLFALFASGAIVEVHPDGTVEGPLAVEGLDTSTARALAVSPLDGRIWIGIGATHKIWSIDPETGEPLLEISFEASSPVWPDEAIRFHSPSLVFRPDGRRLVVTDTQSQLWIFDAVEPQANRPPVAHIANDFPGQVVAIVGGIGQIELDGSGSSDGDGGTQGLSYLWSRVSGPQETEIMDPTASTTLVTIPRPGIHVFALRVDDDQAQENAATTQLGLGALALEATHEGTFAGYQALSMAGIAGDATFAPGPGGGLFALVDDLPDAGGGVYEIVASGGSYRRGRKLAAIERPSALTFTPEGDLWIVRDFSAAAGPHLGVLRQPAVNLLATLEPAIAKLADPDKDDDPFSLAVVPAGFPSDTVAAGDLLILDHGPDGNDPNAIYVYSPAAPRGDPAAFAELFATPEQLAAFSGTDLNDLAFSRDGSHLFVATEGLGIAEIDGDGNVLGTLDTRDAPIANVAGLAVDPATGRLWVAEASLGQVWSLDIEGDGTARIEILFAIWITEFGTLPIELHAPSLAFSPDGQKLVVSDAANRGWLWIFEKPSAPPVGRFRRGDADGNGTVDISDPILDLGFLFLGGRAPVCLDAGDADDSGENDISDAVYTLGFLFLGSRAPPAPGPSECGEDPTVDGLGECQEETCGR